MSSASHSWKKWKLLIGVALGLLMAADAGLGAFLWNTWRQNPASLAAQRDRLALEARELRADVGRGDAIRAALPRVGKDCDHFYRESFLNAGTGYSSIESDLDQIAAKAGLRTDSVTFKQDDSGDKTVTQISINAEVEGSYTAVVQFINGLERSKNFYLLRDLELSAGKGANRGGDDIGLHLTLRTFFRT